MKHIDDICNGEANVQALGHSVFVKALVFR